MTSVFLYPTSMTSYKPFVTIAEYVNNNSKPEAIIFLDEKLDVHHKELDKLGIKYIRYNNNLNQDTIVSKNKSKKYLLKNRFPTLFGFLDFIKEIYRLKKTYHDISNLIKDKQPRALLIYDDREYGIQQVLIKIFKKKSLPVIIVPIAVTTPDEDFLARCKNQSLICSGEKSPFINKIAKKVNSTFCYKKDDLELLYYPASHLLAGYALDLISKNPWYIGGGNSSVLAVDGDKEKLKAINDGIPTNKIVITGNPDNDELYVTYEKRFEYKRDLFQKNNFNTNNKLIIFAVPQVAENNFISWEEHYRILDGMIDSLTKTGHHILLSLHPKSNYDNYKKFEDKYNCKISSQPLKQILPLGDIFVSTYSATVYWAILCSIPTIIVDYYNFNYHLFGNMKGIIKVKENTKLSNALNNLITNQSYYNEMKNWQKESAESITAFDGKARERILSLI